MDAKKNEYIPQDEEEVDTDLLDSRSTLVHVRRGPDTSIFRGWGPKL
ncbi:MAG TPA: hypothetical protein VKF82_00020 [Candidatus Eremiobacteraceae bacterium]|nr:hypothetical protein [Candidatus Eremiobacteraceae bacterium]